MKLIEALKDKKDIIKGTDKRNSRMDKNILLIMQYSSMLSSERPILETEDKQKEKVKELIQSNMDLEKRARKANEIIIKTNLNTTIEIPKGKVLPAETFTLIDCLYFLSVTCKKLEDTFNALTTTAADQRMGRSFNPQNPGERPQIIRMYSEDYKQKALDDLDERRRYIKGRIETINALTEIEDF